MWDEESIRRNYIEAAKQIEGSYFDQLLNAVKMGETAKEAGWHSCPFRSVRLAEEWQIGFDRAR